jgi:glycosyltransferase involved in cell wall biosynthesis
MNDRHVLHVLPHTGGGAQTYIDTLAELDGYRFETFELSTSRSAASAAASIALRRPALLRAAQQADLVHLHGEVASIGTLGLLARHPSVVTLHGLHLVRRLPAGWPVRLGRAGLRAITAAADATICVSETERDELSWLPSRSRARLAVVRNGLPLPPPPDPVTRAELRDSLELPDSAVVVLYLGQLEKRKDPMTALRAVQRVHRQDPRVVLLLAGTGPCAPQLATAAGDETRMLGHRTDVERLLAGADVFVMPSIREGLSYAVLEAMGHGVATVVSDGPGNPEAVGEAGVVFATGDVAGLASLLAELAANPVRRAALGQAGRDRAATELSADEMRRQTRAVYDAVLTGPGRRGGGPPA